MWGLGKISYLLIDNLHFGWINQRCITWQDKMLLSKCLFLSFVVYTFLYFSHGCDFSSYTLLNLLIIWIIIMKPIYHSKYISYHLNDKKIWLLKKEKIVYCIFILITCFERSGIVKIVFFNVKQLFRLFSVACNVTWNFYNNNKKKIVKACITCYLFSDCSYNNAIL